MTFSATDHPITLLPRLEAIAGQRLGYEFSKYIYVPQSTNDEREYLRISSEETSSEVPKLLAQLRANQELAFHSRIWMGEQSAHLPMLDLAGEFSKAHLSGVTDLFREFAIREFAVFHSGRSAHVYGLGFLSSEKLVQFFGHALLLNLPDATTIVDSRWIGHRIYAGYGSLRWSWNSPQYLGSPTLIGIYPVA